MRKLILLLLLSIPVIAFSQKRSQFEKFGKITKGDLEKKLYSIDSNANAVVLASIGETSFEGNNKDWFAIRTKIHKVVHILSDKGYDEANVEIPLYGSGSDAEAVRSFKATTYNLEGDKIVETKIGSSSLVKEKVDDDRSVAKFTMPGVKNGSIIEYYYEVLSDYISQPDPWYFQSLTAPTLWSEFIFESPSFLNYRLFFRGYEIPKINEKGKSSKGFRVSEERSVSSSKSVSFVATVFSNRWVIEDAPELKTEAYTKSIRNHITRVEFQLISFLDPLPAKNLTTTWQEISSRLMESTNFGKNLTTGNNWLKDELNTIAGDEKDPLAKARKVFQYVRDDFKTTDDGGLYLKDNLKNVFKAKSGTVSELNVLLTAMLKYVDLTADPVILSTTSHGYAVEQVPMLNSMNYVICCLRIGGKKYYLDASQSKIGFGKLPLYCYNGLGVTVNEAAVPIDLSSDSIVDESELVYNFKNTEGGYVGDISKKKGYYYSLDLRDEYSDQKKNEMISDLKKGYGDLFQVSDYSIDSVDNYESPVNIHYKLRLNNDGEEILYINPYMGENYTKNPFASADRSYPVEFPCQTGETILATFQVPEGYKIDELPKSITVFLDDTRRSYFYYQILSSGSKISFVSKFKIGKTFFLPQEYNSLRQFFDYVVKKQAEQIVLKKIEQ